MPDGVQSAETPRFSVVTACFNDCWGLVRTVRSVAAQKDAAVEHLVVDGGSTDGTADVIAFFRSVRDIRFCSEPDRGVYDAMNKGVRGARGDYVLFLNAGDVFEDAWVLSGLDSDLRKAGEPDGMLGVGRVGSTFWAPWRVSRTLKIASLGFCHQALVLRRRKLLDLPFEVDSRLIAEDREQLLRVWSSGGQIDVTHRLIAARDPKPGLSADPERVSRELQGALEAFFTLSPDVARLFADFRMKGQRPEAVLDHARKVFDDAVMRDFAPFFIDTLFCRQCRLVDAAQARVLLGTLVTELDQRDLFPDLAPELQAFFAMKRRETDLRAEARRRAAPPPQAHRIAAKRHRFGFGPERRFDFTVRMTSFPARIEGVADVVDSMLRQSRPPRAIQLVLAKTEFSGPDALPPDLSALERHGLSIVWADDNYLHYKKLFPFDNALRDQPVVLCDDDVYYHADDFEKLLESYRQYPTFVHANRVHTMTLSDDGEIAPYSAWVSERGLARPSHLNFATGVGGVLYPPGFFVAPEVLDLNLILRHAPLADDVWLKFQAVIQDRPVACTTEGRWTLRYTDFMEAGALHHENALGNMNDIQIRRCAVLARARLKAAYETRIQ